MPLTLTAFGLFFIPIFRGEKLSPTPYAMVFSRGEEFEIAININTPHSNYEVLVFNCTVNYSVGALPEWSKGMHLGCIEKSRRFKSCRHQSFNAGLQIIWNVLCFGLNPCIIHETLLVFFLCREL